MTGYPRRIPLSTFLFLTLFIQQDFVFGCSGGGNDKTPGVGTGVPTIHNPNGTSNQGPNKNCPYGQFPCNDGKKCYTEAEKCNDHQYCDDNTDEDTHHCGKLSPL